MNELLSLLLKDGGIVAFGIVMLFTVKAIPAVIRAIKEKGPNGNGALAERMRMLEEEVKRLRDWRHEVGNKAQEIIAADYFKKKSGP